MAQTTPNTPKKNTALIVIISIIGSLVIIGIVLTTIVIVSGLSDHDGNLGTAKQQQTNEITAINSSIKARNLPQVLDVSVENTNTSGTPFGHDVTVSVLLDNKQFEGTTFRETFIEVVKAIHEAGVEDTYKLYLQPDTSSSVQSGIGSTDKPLTNAKDIHRVNDYGIAKRYTATQKEFGLNDSTTAPLRLTWDDIVRISKI